MLAIIAILKKSFKFDSQYFLLPINRESIVIKSSFRRGDFDGFTRF